MPDEQLTEDIDLNEAVLEDAQDHLRLPRNSCPAGCF
jgi:hypothetical protein